MTAFITLVAFIVFLLIVETVLFIKDGYDWTYLNSRYKG